ncbi:hypothetical protein AB0O28_14905 [Microbispora sp. NPDC088329]|uniref:hypothetical protein n=1 Tax=Microbispora sp. NPDC088329 TaxID=3154869 RepID=UPI003421E2CC
MRTVDDLRRRWLDQVRHVVLLSGMWACNGREMESVARTLLENLCFLDERDREYEEVREELGRYGQVGVPGPFTALFGTEQRCMAEVASVYAEQFHRLGYLAVDRELGPQEWDELTRLGAPGRVGVLRLLRRDPHGVRAWGRALRPLGRRGPSGA